MGSRSTYFCDRCNESITDYAELNKLQRPTHPYNKVELCDDCYEKLDRTWVSFMRYPRRHKENASGR